MECNNDYIAVIDSGVGGISVLKELIKVLPNENFLYFGDNVNAPYGTKTSDEVKNIMINNVSELIRRGAKAIVIACNTATAASIAELRDMYKDFSIIGIEPAIKPAVLYKKNSNILVMATPLTLKEDKFLALLNRFSQDANIITLPCPGLMELVEEGKISGPETEEFLNNLFEDIKKEHIDSVVLGCTHYPFVKNAIKKVLGEDIKIFDGGEGTSRETQRKLLENNIENKSGKNGEIIIECSDSKKDIKELSYKLLNL